MYALLQPLGNGSLFFWFCKNKKVVIIVIVMNYYFCLAFLTILFSYNTLQSSALHQMATMDLIHCLQEVGLLVFFIHPY